MKQFQFLATQFRGETAEAYRVLKDTLDKKAANCNHYQQSNQYGDLLIFEAQTGKYRNQRTHLLTANPHLQPLVYECVTLEAVYEFVDTRNNSQQANVKLTAYDK